MYSKSYTDYADSLNKIDKDLIKKVCASIDFGIHDPLEYHGVNLFLLDLTTNSATGTFKDWVAGYTVAHCIQHNIPGFVTQSSGNFANSIAHFANKFGIKVTILYPRLSRYKIISEGHSDQYIKFIEVDKAEKEIKALTEELCAYLSLPWLPAFEHQVESNKIRAHFVQEYSSLKHIHFDYMSQALSSGFGIFGFYRGVCETEYFRINNSPAFIGIQQSMVPPFYRYIYNSNGYEPDREMIEPTLFRSAPPVSFLEEMKNIVETSDGCIDLLYPEEFDLYLPVAESLFHEREIEITRIGGKIVEKSGLIALIGALKLIDSARIRIGSNVLVSVTGGTANGKRGDYIPERILNKCDSKEKLFNLIS